MEFVILGPTRLIVDDQEVPLGVAKQRGLLALLLYHAGSPVRFDTVLDHLWPGGAQERHRASLYALASRIRRTLRDVGRPDALVRLPSTAAYRLDVDPDLIDFHRFRRRVAVARQAAAAGEHERAVELLEPAIDAWLDEPIADLHGERSEQLRQHMLDVRLTGHKLLADSLLRLGRHHAVLARLEPLLEANDVDEGLAEPWIAALQATGRERDAQHFSVEFRRRYRRQLRLEPTIARLRTGAGLTGREPARAEDRPAVAQQLPPDIHDFCGHADLLAELDRLADAERPGPCVVLVDGMPGSGKTTLAVRWAHRRRDRFPDGQLYLNANGYGPASPMTAEDALSRLLQSLGLRAEQLPSTVELRRERFNQLLAGRRVVVILDNVSSFDQVRPLIPTAGPCVTIITSRNRLRGLTIRHGVRTITVAPLPPDDCLTLLTSIVGAARVGRDRPAARALGQLSGGLPLAVRIVAEYVAERPRADITALVAQLRTNLLDYGSGEDEAIGLRTVFAWSYAALDPAVARLFRLLGCYAGPSISPASAGALLGGAPRSAERMLDTLAGAHLLSHDTAGRYRLHDVLRLYATERAATEESAESRRAALGRLVDWYVLSAANALAAAAPQSPPVPDLPPATATPAATFGRADEAMMWCEVERPNLVALVHLAADNGFHRQAWQIPGAVCQLLARYGRQDDVVEIHHIAVVAARADGHVEGRLGTYNNLGATLFAVHDYLGAAEQFGAALQVARANGLAAAEAMCSHNLASVYLKSGDTAAALATFAEVLAVCRAIGHRPGLASTLCGIGDARRRRAEYGEAAHRYREALRVQEEIGWLRGQAATLSRLAELALETARASEALEYCGRAIRILDTDRDEGTRCDVLTTAADAHRTLGRLEASGRSLDAALGIASEIGDFLRQARALAVEADLRLGRSDVDGARSRCGLAFELIRDTPGPDVDDVRRRLGQIAESIPRTLTGVPRPAVA